MTTCHLLEHLRALLRKRLDAGETLPEISEDIDTPLSTLRKWLYKATTGDALALERAIYRLDGGRRGTRGWPGFPNE